MLRWKSSLKPASGGGGGSGTSPGTANLVAAYDFNDASGTGQNDLHTAGPYNLTENGTSAWTTGTPNYYSGETSADYLSSTGLPNAWASSEQDWSMVARYKDVQINRSPYWGGGSREYITFRSGNGHEGRIGGGTAVTVSTSASYAGQWVTVYMEYNSSTNKVTIKVLNENLSATSAAFTPVWANSEAIIGGRLGDGGDIDFMYFFSDLLTADEILWFGDNSSIARSYSDLSGGGPTSITLEDSAVTTAIDFSSPVNVDVNIPAVSANDILLLFCTTNDYSEPTSSPPAGWTKIAEKDAASTNISTVAAYWKRASSSASATTETWSSFFAQSEVYYVWVGAYSGCVTSGSPVDAYGSSTVSFGTPWSVNVTTTTADTMIVTISGNTNPNITHTWYDGTELIDTAYFSANATVSINEKLEATAGSKTRTVTPSVTTGNAMIAVALKPPSSSIILEERFEESDSGGALGSSTDGYDSSLVSSEVTTTGSTIDPDESTTSVLSGSQSLEIDSASGDNYVEFDLGSDYDELWFHVEVNRIYSGVSNRSILKFFNQSGTLAADLKGSVNSKPTMLSASAASSFTYANPSAVDHFWLHWVRNSTSTFYFAQNSSTRPTSGGDVVSFTAADVAIGKFQIGSFNLSGNYRYDDIIVSTSEIGDDP